MGHVEDVEMSYSRLAAYKSSTPFTLEISEEFYLRVVRFFSCSFV
jgi:hypothetical protein